MFVVFDSWDTDTDLSNSASKTRDFSHADTEDDFFRTRKKVIKACYTITS